MRRDVGMRLLHVRAARSQQEMAAVMGVAPRTYAYYEQGERIPDGESLAPLVTQGWNINWLLTGEGPERLEVLPGAGSSGSQVLRMDGATLRDAVEAVDAALAAMDIEAGGAERARLYSAMYEYLASGDASPGQATAAVLRLIHGGRR